MQCTIIMSLIEPSDKFVKYPQISTAVEVIDCEVAKKLLDLNFGNRNINARRVSLYLSQMDSGLWGLGDPLMFDKHGDLLNGQHRLSAAARASTPQSFLVIRGLEPEAKQYIDTGMSRTLAQVTQISGVKYTYHSERLAILKAAFLGSRLTPKSASAEKNARHLWTDKAEKKAPSFWLPLLESYEEPLDFVLKGFLKGLVTAPVQAVLLRAYFTQNHQSLREFSTLVTHGQFDQEDDRSIVATRDAQRTAINFRNYLVEHRSKKKAVDSRRDLYCKTESALRAFLKGSKLTQFTASKIENFPVPDFD